MDRAEYAELAERESRHWAKLNELQQEGLSWLDSPTIEKFVNWRISGDPNLNWFGWVCETFAEGRERGPGMSLGCNDGTFDRQIMQEGICTEFDGYDISAGAVRDAKKTAEKEELKINYHEADLNFPDFPENHYSLVVAVMSLHHVDRLEELFDQVNRSLLPKGIFAINEYVGPNRFQYGDEQLQAINDLLPMLPKRLRKRQVDGEYIDKVSRVRVEDLVEATPFEAIRSEEILPLLRKHFTVLEQRDYGGSVLCWLLNYLMPNFKDDSEDDQAILSLLCRIEYLLTQPEGLPSDFSVIVATKKQD